jgi:hypothetical protein
MAIQFGQKNYGDIVAIKELLGGISDLDIRNRMQKLMMAKDLADKAQVSEALSKVNLSDPNSVAEGYQTLLGLGTPRATEAFKGLVDIAKLPQEEYSAISVPNVGAFTYGRRSGKTQPIPGTEQKQDLMSAIKQDPALSSAYNVLYNVNATTEDRQMAYNRLTQDPRLAGVGFIVPDFQRMATPTELSRYQSELDAIKKANPNDTRIPQYEAAIKKLTEGLPTFQLKETTTGELKSYNPRTGKLVGEGTGEFKVSGSTRTMMEGAQMLQPHIPEVDAMAAELDKRGLFGPVMSRVREAMTKVGTINTSNPDDTQSKLSQFATTLDDLIANDSKLNTDALVGKFAASLDLLASGAGRVHGGARGGGSIQMIEYLHNVLSAKGSYQMFKGRLAGLNDYMLKYAAGPHPKEQGKTESTGKFKILEVK